MYLWHRCRPPPFGRAGMSDRELDRAIAEQVMGWRLSYEHDNTEWVSGNCGEKYECGLYDFAPTSDPAAMLQVIERMRELGFNMTICAVKEGYAAAFTTALSITGERSYQPNLCRAVCLAA